MSSSSLTNDTSTCFPAHPHADLNYLIHDMRVSITTTLTCFAVLRKSIAPEDYSLAIEQALEAGPRSARKTLNMINMMLDAPRLSTGDYVLQRGRVELHTLIANSIADLTPLARDYGVAILNEASLRLPPLEADGELLNRVFQNLLDNALKFTPPYGEIEVHADYFMDQAPYIRCSVLDSGPGIPAEYLDDIFTRTGPLAPGHRRGAGLGLPFCQLVIARHGGHIWAENRPEGGAAFYFTLPLDQTSL